MPTAAQSTSGGSRVAEGAQSSKSAFSTAPPNLHPIGVGGPIASTHDAQVVRWHSTHVMDGPSFGYLVRTFKAASVGSRVHITAPTENGSSYSCAQKLNMDLDQVAGICLFHQTSLV